jgi:hypothetical protein
MNTTEYPYRVRVAHPSDEEEIMTLCKRLHSENAIFPMDDDKVLFHLRKAFHRDGSIMGVIGQSGSIEGMIYMSLSSFWYAKRQHWEEYFVYTPPEYRKSKNAQDLLKFAKWCSESTDTPLLTGVISDHRMDGKVRLYQRQLGEPKGAFFFYDSKK